MKKILMMLTICAITSAVFAKTPKVAIYYNQYLTLAGESYVETYFALDPRSIILKQTENGKMQGGIQCLLMFKQADKVVGLDKFLLLSTEISDTLVSNPYTIQQSRVKLPPGSYTMVVDIQDMANLEDSIHFEHEFDVVVNREEITASSILLLESFREVEEENYASKWGYELVPIVPVGTYYIPEQYNKLPFYLEVFNSDISLGADEPFLIRYYLTDKMTNQMLERYAGFQRANGSVVNPVLNTFNIAKLPSGYYELVVDVISKENETVASQTLPFYRSNPTADKAQFDLENVSLDNSFVAGMGDIDTLSYYLDCLYPISTDAERRLGTSLIDARDIDQMQRFFQSFWVKRAPQNPKEEWQGYMVEVDKAHDLYGTSGTPGYRTDMGRVFLQYGAPTTIERSPYAPAQYPWQIWQYDQLRSASTPVQNNQIFVFVDQAMAGRNYYLIHSTAISEIRDHKWRYQLNRNTNRGGNVDDTSVQNGRDDFGYRVDNNFIIGDQRYWGDR